MRYFENSKISMNDIIRNTFSKNLLVLLSIIINHSNIKLIMTKKNV